MVCVGVHAVQSMYAACGTKKKRRMKATLYVTFEYAIENCGERVEPRETRHAAVADEPIVGAARRRPEVEAGCQKRRPTLVPLLPVLFPQMREPLDGQLQEPRDSNL